VLDTFSVSNKRFAYQYKDHFIFASRYSFVHDKKYTRHIKNYDYFRVSAESSGNLLNIIYSIAGIDKKENNTYEIWGMPFAQYIRLETEYKHYWIFSKDRSFVVRSMLGVGLPYGNSKSLPFEKGFFAGGTNYIRAWSLYRLGPGSYYDPSRPSIEQFGDINLINNIEYRFPIYNSFKGALFVDFGNTWLKNNDPEFPEGNFRFNKFYDDIAVGAGFGVRWDIDYFVIRVDFALPLRSPIEQDGTKWIFDQLKINKFVINLGIGYPF
jgi:outer membrane protein assembly factor BamA